MVQVNNMICRLFVLTLGCNICMHTYIIVTESYIYIYNSDLFSCEKLKAPFGGRGRKAKVMWNCVVVAVFCVIWMESGSYWGWHEGGVGGSSILVVITGCGTPAFRDLSFLFIGLDWRAAAR